jgi:putative MFS transporter
MTLDDVAIDRTHNLQGIAQVIARIERLPFTWFHLKARILVGTATFFDAFDALAIAYVLPVLIPQWQLTPTAIGALISIGYVGQALGAIFFGWLAERRGRMLALTITVAIYGIFSLLAAFAWDYTSLFVIRTIQGIGLGGEVPIAATYINEISRARERGRFVLLYECVFPLGLFCAALLGVWIVPTFGWHWMFIIGALPALLVLPLRWLLPESPRWLAQHGQFAQADRIVTSLEMEASKKGVELPSPNLTLTVTEHTTRWQELFQGIYLQRTLVVWLLWFCAYFATYGIVTWLPSIYTSVFRLPLNQALQYSLVTQAFGLLGTIICALTIDHTGRRPAFTLAFILGSASLTTLWLLGANSPIEVVLLATIANIFIYMISLGLYLYTPEIYPTRMRALGSSIGSVWLRVASAIGPLVMGVIVANYPLSTAFLLFGAVLLLGGVIVGLFGIETKGAVLEEISP